MSLICPLSLEANNQSTTLAHVLFVLKEVQSLEDPEIWECLLRGLLLSVLLHWTLVEKQQVSLEEDILSSHQPENIHQMTLVKED